MIAGTLAVLERPADDILEDWIHDSGLPALSVERTQKQLDGSPAIQRGKAARFIDVVEQSITAGHVYDGDGVYVDVEQLEARRKVATEWVADVAGSGVVLAESIAGSEPVFPFDLVWSRTEREPVRQGIAVDDLHTRWGLDDELGEVWMTGAEHEDDDGVSIGYHDAADETEIPTIGLGFKRPWDGTAVRGVVYESGYVALYSASTISEGVRFVAEELLPFCHELDEGGDTRQATLGGTGREGGDAE